MTLTILQLLPELLNVNGDAENALVLARRAEWSGVDTRIVPETREPDLVVIGSGFDMDLPAIAAALYVKEKQLRDAADKGIPILAIGLGFELLASRVTLRDGSVIGGLGLLPGETVPAVWVSGEIVVESRFGMLFGYENSDRGYALPAGAEPLGTVLHGVGNGHATTQGAKGSEGIIHGSVIGSHIHGPVLANCPQFADALLDIATGGAYRPSVDRVAEADELASRMRARALASVTVAKPSAVT